MFIQFLRRWNFGFWVIYMGKTDSLIHWSQKSRFFEDFPLINLLRENPRKIEISDFNVSENQFYPCIWPKTQNFTVSGTEWTLLENTISRNIISFDCNLFPLGCHDFENHRICNFWEIHEKWSIFTEIENHQKWSYEAGIWLILTAETS